MNSRAATKGQSAKGQRTVSPHGIYVENSSRGLFANTWEPTLSVHGCVPSRAAFTSTRAKRFRDLTGNLHTWRCEHVFEPKLTQHMRDRCACCPYASKSPTRAASPGARGEYRSILWPLALWSLAALPTCEIPTHTTQFEASGSQQELG